MIRTYLLVSSHSKNDVLWSVLAGMQECAAVVPPVDQNRTQSGSHARSGVKWADRDATPATGGCAPRPTDRAYGGVHYSNSFNNSSSGEECSNSNVTPAVVWRTPKPEPTNNSVDVPDLE